MSVSGSCGTFVVAELRDLAGSSPSDHLEGDPPEETKNGYAFAESEKWRVDEASNRHDAEIDRPRLHRLRMSFKCET